MSLSEPEFVRLKMIELRQSRGLSQQEFGSALGLSAANISSLELGKHEWSLSHLTTARLRFNLPLSFYNREDLPGEEGTKEFQRQSTALLHQISRLSPASKAALHKYSLLSAEQRALIDKMILESAKSKDLSVLRAVLALLRKSIQ